MKPTPPLQMYDNFFPIKKIKLKPKDLKSPRIKPGIKQSSKRKQQLCKKYLKNRTPKNEREYKDYKALIKPIKYYSKKLYFSSLINKCKTNIKKSWQVIKEALRKRQDNCQVFPEKIVVNKKNNPNIESIDIILIAFLLTLVQI